MLALDFFAWWYGQGWRQLLRNMQTRFTRTARMFSAPILLRTLFAPWRRIITYPGAGLDARMRAVADNLVSRAVGFTVRLFILFTAGIVLLFVGLIAAVELIFWPLAPLALVAALVKGIIG